MNVEDVLRDKGRHITVVQDTDLVTSVIHELSAKRIGAVIVKDRFDKMVGIFSERDLMNALARHDAQVLTSRVRELMSAHVLTCKASDRVDDVLKLMTKNRIRHVPVMNGGELVGIVSIGDLVQHRLVEKEMEANVLLDITRMRA